MKQNHVEYGLEYHFDWPYSNRADLDRYLAKQKGSDLDRQQYPLIGYTVMEIKEPGWGKVHYKFILRSLKI